MSKYTISWRSRIVIEADNSSDARAIFEELSLGELDQAVADKKITSHEFVEETYVEKIDK